MGKRQLNVSSSGFALDPGFKAGSTSSPEFIQEMEIIKIIAEKIKKIVRLFIV
jgi:hypothetical protein